MVINPIESPLVHKYFTDFKRMYIYIIEIGVMKDECAYEIREIKAGLLRGSEPGSEERWSNVVVVSSLIEA